MTEDEVIEIAKATVEQSGWTWLEPIEVTRYRKYILFGSFQWKVRTNSRSLGSIATVILDDDTGEVVSKGYIPR